MRLQPAFAAAEHVDRAKSEIRTMPDGLTALQAGRFLEVYHTKMQVHRSNAVEYVEERECSALMC